MDGGEALESDAQTPEFVQPGMGWFDDPAGFAQAAAKRSPRLAISVVIPAACKGLRYLSWS